MKRFALLAIATLCIALTSCSRNTYNPVVKETYIHKYGVPCTKDDWETHGGSGKIVKLRSDGITVAHSYSKGVLDSETTYTFPNSSTVEKVETYDNGLLTACKVSYANGVPHREEKLKNGKLAQLNIWYEDGTPALSESYEEDFLTFGEYRTALNEIEARVQNGHGVRICRTSLGELASKDTIQNGQMVERITFFVSGDPETVTPYKNHKIHGMRLTFHPGGLPKTVEQWTAGEQDGTTVVYHNGEKASEIPYVHGKKQGVEKRFRDGLLLVEEVTWTNDVQHGQRKLFIDGDTRTEWYHQGELVSRPTFERMNMPRA